MYYKSHLPHDPLVIIRRTKQRIMSSSLSLEYEAIMPTQSVECVPETETQDEIPETQESVSNFDIFYPDDYTSDDDATWGMAECTGCRPLLFEANGGEPRLCASCGYYQCDSHWE